MIHRPTGINYKGYRVPTVWSLHTADRVIELKEKGLSVRDICKVLDVKLETVRQFFMYKPNETTIAEYTHPSDTSRDSSVWSVEEFDFALYAYYEGRVKLHVIAKFLQRSIGLVTSVILNAEEERIKTAISRIKDK